MFLVRVLVLSMLLTGGVVSTRAFAGMPASASKKRPNILFILLDNVGKDWFRCYGSQQHATPNIDQLAYTGMKFRSISARKIRAREDAARRAKWVVRNQPPPNALAPFFHPPKQFADKFGDYHSPLLTRDGRRVTSARQWKRRRAELRHTWQTIMGPWPPLLENPRMETVRITRRGTITQRQVRLEIGLGREMVDGFFLIPDGDGPFPAVLVLYYDAQTGAGLGTPMRDFGWQLAKRGFVTLSIGKPNSRVHLDDYKKIPGRGLPYFGPAGKPVTIQPLSALAYAAVNARVFLSRRPEVYADRIGVVGHSFGGKWALFASCLDDGFACAVWSDPGIVFDERDRRKQNPGGSVNYWDPWYLGTKPGTIYPKGQQYFFRKPPSANTARTGAYKQLVETGHDLVELHALMAPRPVLVSGGTADLPERWTALNHLIAVNRLLGYENRVAMTNRKTHAPTETSNEQIYRFFQWWLLEQRTNKSPPPATRNTQNTQTTKNLVLQKGCGRGEKCKVKSKK